ncbi:MAG: tRNA (N6-isopentenyl adenosine(37)-C2)-methylthiotransferase MiaB, partial [Phycisphaerae bacterium]|nr:tRNA (N6-isopentenyl adenosine(37)-C2)-methylthiotransferase MiaB [Phycisphaerae bacterium]
MPEKQATNHGLVYLRSYGCQMNSLDTELVAGQLRAAGYDLTDDMEMADVILLNTCSVRRHAEQRVHSNLGAMRRLPRHPVIGIMGCMAEMHREKLIRRFPQISFLCGPAQLHRIPALVAEAEEGRRVLAIDPPRAHVDRDSLAMQDRSLERVEARRPDATSARAYVRVMRGCDRFCTYCVVPFVRGPERSRPPEKILAEVRRLVDTGCKQVTLLGQTVNSYAFKHDGRVTRLADLLYELSEVPGLSRLSFVTSHPRDFTEELAKAMAEVPQVMPYLHLPAQSGSDTVLRRMNRGYTAAEYAERIAIARHHVHHIAVASDFIVGFPGETDEDFDATCDLMQEVRFTGGFIFKYSPRPRTVAAKRLTDDVPDAVKRERNNRLLTLSQEISIEDNQLRVGRVVSVLVEGPSKRPTLDGGGH